MLAASAEHAIVLPINIGKERILVNYFVIGFCSCSWTGSSVMCIFSLLESYKRTNLCFSGQLEWNSNSVKTFVCVSVLRRRRQQQHYSHQCLQQCLHVHLNTTCHQPLTSTGREESARTIHTTALTVSRPCPHTTGMTIFLSLVVSISSVLIY